MNKTIAKTESVADFLARGGKINKLPAKQAKKHYSRKNEPKMKLEELDLSALPAALKIKYGIK